MVWYGSVTQFSSPRGTELHRDLGPREVEAVPATEG